MKLSDYKGKIIKSLNLVMTVNLKIMKSFPNHTQGFAI